MGWFHAFLIGYWAANAVSSIALIGRPHTITKNSAAVLVVLYLLLILATVVHVS